MHFTARVGDRTTDVTVRGRDGSYTVTVDGSTLQIDVVETGDHFSSLIVDGRSHDLGVEKRPGGYRVHGAGDAFTVALSEGARGAVPSRPEEGPARLIAPMPGRVVRVLTTEGSEVEAGQGLVVIEAMKMENELRAPRQGQVREVTVQEGQAVDAGALLVVVA